MKNHFDGTKSQADYYFGQTNGHGQFKSIDMYGDYVCRACTYTDDGQLYRSHKWSKMTNKENQQNVYAQY